MPLAPVTITNEHAGGSVGGRKLLYGNQQSQDSQ